MTIDLCPEDLIVVQEILHRRLPGVSVVAFGSRVDGKASRWSDLDLMLLTESPVELAVLGDLREAFSESDLPIRVDVVDGATTSAEFRAAAMRCSKNIV